MWITCGMLDNEKRTIISNVLELLCFQTLIFSIALTCFIIIKREKWEDKEPVTSNMDCDDWLTPLTVFHVAHAGTEHHWLSDSICYSVPLQYVLGLPTAYFVYKYSVQTWHSSHQCLMMETKTVSEISDTNSTLIWLIAWEDIITDFIIHYDCIGGMSDKQSQTLKSQNNIKQNPRI
jgi:hypothetical protein